MGRIAICMLLAVCSGIAQADTVTPSDRVITHVNVRANPDTSQPPIGKLTKDEGLEYVAEVPGWYQVQLGDGRDGFVSKSWTKRVATSVAPYAGLRARARQASCDATGKPAPLGKYTAGPATQRLMWVHRGHLVEVYCGCPYDEDKDVDIEACGYEPDSTAKNTQRIEWEHVVPASHFGNNRDCWKRVGNKSGRINCRDTDEEFRLMEADLYNLQPAIGRLNNIRSNHRYAEVDGDAITYGNCEFKVGYREDDETIIEPPDDVKGDLARAVFYMADKYGQQTIQLSSAEVAMYMEWTEDDPIDDWELERSCRINKIQGWVNPYVQTGN